MRRWNLTIHMTAAIVAVVGLSTITTHSRGVEPTDLRLAVNSADSAAAAAASSEISARLFVGTSSCTAVSCHGNTPDRGLIGSEHTRWLQDDKHADAYNVLFNDVSVQMAKALKLETPAHQAALCLNCHGPTSEHPYPASITATQQHVVQDGVSCEACHGASSKWLGPHIRADWKSKSVEQKAQYGFRDTKDLWTRAKLCADCHVGAPGRDVNHDLYAAGHPRLSFELSAFHSLMPAHWDRNRDRATAAGMSLTQQAGKVEKSPLEAKLWSLGQVASAEAALDLLIHRAKSATTTSEIPAKYPSAAAVASWPELAETACFACHHNLSAPSWRQSAGRYSNRKPGGSPWGTWLFPLVPQAAELAGIEMKATSGPLAELTREMSKPLPNQKLVIDHATGLQIRLNGIGKDLNKKTPSADDIGKLFVRVATSGGDLSKQSWDEATQVYLALVALNRAHRDASGQPVSASGSPECNETIPGLCELRSVLEFEPGYDSPLKYLSKPDVNLEEKLNQIKVAFEKR